MKHVNRLFENKNHLIDRLNLTLSQKEELKNFFAKHPTYESKIDWNNKKLTYDDFKLLLALDGKSKTQAKSKGIEGLVEDVDYKYWGEETALIKINSYKKEPTTFRAYQPLTYLGSQVLASNKVPPVRDNGAKWCIAYQKTSKYWDDYTGRGIQFLFLCTPDTKYAFTVYPNNSCEIYDFNDYKLGSYKEKNEEEDENEYNEKDPLYVNEDAFMDAIEDLSIVQNFRDSGQRLRAQYLLNNQVPLFLKWGYWKQNEDGTYDVLKKPRDYDSFLYSSFMLDGKLCIKFNHVNDSMWLLWGELTTLEGSPKKVTGTFNCDHNHLKTLIGGPEKVGGMFDCAYNELTSLKGAPKEVGHSFNCSHNNLTSLKGAPRFDHNYSWGCRLECSFNPITSLEGAFSKRDSEENRISLYCHDCELTSLKGLPKKLVTLDCRNNKLTSLEEITEDTTCEKLDCRNNPNLPEEEIDRILDRVYEFVESDYGRKQGTLKRK